MSAKNYYRLLQLPPTASQSDIRKAYRRLAMMYHPDKNKEPIAEMHFREIQEAYHHLSDAHRRSAYDQKHWFAKHQSNVQAKEPLTAASIHRKTEKLTEYLRKIHNTDINKQALAEYLHHLVNRETAALIAGAADGRVKKEIIYNVLKASSYVSPTALEKISADVITIAGNDEALASYAESLIAEARFSNRYQHYKPWIILSIAVLLCIFIYIAAR